MKKAGWPTAFLAVLVIVYLGFQIVRSASSSVETQKAQEYTAKKTVSAQGYVIRSESPVTYEGGGVLRYTAADGARVSKNGVIAEVYPAEEQALGRGRLEALEAEIAMLKAAQTKQEGVAVDLKALERQIFDGYLSSLRKLDAGEDAGASDALGEVMGLLNRKQIISGEAADFGARIGALEAQAGKLEAALAKSPKTVSSDYAGYFVRGADGFESAVKFENAASLTVGALERAREAAENVPGSIVGKIVRDYEWYIAAEISEKQAFLIREGADMQLELPFSKIGLLPVKVAALNRDGKTGKAVAVFQCGYMNSELAAIRSQPVRILIRTYAGLRVPRRAVRTDAGRQGVYVLKGTIAQFCEIRILYAASDYFIIAEDGAVRLFDEIITKGKGLRDGKIVG